jgi:lysophospholipase L1-like esterase
MPGRAALPAIAALLIAASACSNGAAPLAARKDIPAAIAAAGDSITRAFNVGVCCVLSDDPERSWATGDSVRSHYERLRGLAGDRRIAEYNVARTGARMDDLERQLREAASLGASYVTIMMGANDLCVSGPSATTSPGDFEARFTRSLKALTAARPGVRIFVASIPNLYQLWSVLHADRRAQAAWDRYHLCPSMLSGSRTPAERAAVVAREKRFNAILERICGKTRGCRYDGGATYRFRFRPVDVSGVDFYHPSARGQASLAEITWRASFWS